MRPGLFDVSRRWPRKCTRGNSGTSLREQWNFSLSSIQFVGLILPSNSHVDTPLRSLPITGRPWNGMFDCHRVEITVMQFTGHSLLVHPFVTAPWDFYLVLYCQPSCILQSYSSAEIQLVYSLSPANWAELRLLNSYIYIYI